ncbi:hypothetical protein [Streptosporangium vulgare]|uniref:hypothetical protein n=1 Tax=Streptosporangium vulgare TaxID=46190 RepID=UPI0031D073DA
MTRTRVSECPRQQGPHVLGVEGVVQHGEHAAAGQLGAPQGAALGRGGRDALGGHPELAQEGLQRGPRPRPAPGPRVWARRSMKSRPSG